MFREIQEFENAQHLKNKKTSLKYLKKFAIF
jgi:hypothetical protein